MNSFFHFTNPIILIVSGKDSLRYLQARLTNNILELDDNQSVYAACLSPQGKTGALFYVTKISNEEFILTTLSGDEENVIRSLSCFIVADQVTISSLSNTHQLIYITKKAFDSNSISIKDNDFLIFNNRFNTESIDLLISNKNIEEISKQLININELSENEFNLNRILSKLPEFNFEIKEDSLFIESQRYDAISNTKGCYAGQEVVERVLAKGKPPAVISAFKVDNIHDLSVGDSIYTADKDVAGTILSYAYSKTDTYFYARVKQKYIDNSIYLLIKEELVSSQCF